MQQLDFAQNGDGPRSKGDPALLIDEDQAFAEPAIRILQPPRREQRPAAKAKRPDFTTVIASETGVVE